MIKWGRGWGMLSGQNKRNMDNCIKSGWEVKGRIHNDNYFTWKIGTAYKFYARLGLKKLQRPTAAQRWVLPSSCARGQQLSNFGAKNLKSKLKFKTNSAISPPISTENINFWAARVPSLSTLSLPLSTNNSSHASSPFWYKVAPSKWEEGKNHYKHNILNLFDQAPTGTAKLQMTWRLEQSC